MALVGQTSGQDSAGIMWGNARGDDGRTAYLAVDGLERDPEAKAEFVITNALPNRMTSLMSTMLLVQPDGQVVTSISFEGEWRVLGFKGSNASTLIDDAMAVGLDLDGSIIYVDMSDGDPVLRAEGDPALALQLDETLIGDVLATGTSYVMVTMGSLEGGNRLWSVSRDGTVAWVRDLDPGYLVSGPPAIDAGGNIYLCSNSMAWPYELPPVEDNSIYYIFRSNGELRFRQGLDELYAYPVSPVIGGDGVPYVLLYTANTVTYNGISDFVPDVTSVVAFHDSGRLKYKFEFEDGYVMLSEPAVDTEGRLYVMAQNVRVEGTQQGAIREAEGVASLWAISAAGRHRWNRTLGGPLESFHGPIIDVQGSVYALSDDTIDSFRWYGGWMFTYQLSGSSTGMVFGTNGDLWVTSTIMDQYGQVGMLTITNVGEGEPWVYQNLVYMGMLIMLLPMMLVVVAVMRTED